VGLIGMIVISAQAGTTASGILVKKHNKIKKI
jgi:hypothetical protein